MMMDMSMRLQRGFVFTHATIKRRVEIRPFPVYLFV